MNECFIDLHSVQSMNFGFKVFYGPNDISCSLIMRSIFELVIN